MNLRSVFAASAVLVSSAAPATAGDAFFSPDGKTVTFIPLTRQGILWRLDIASGKLQALPLPTQEGPTGVARGAEGETLFTTGSGAWVLKEDGTAKKLCDPGPAKDATNLFVATKPGTPVSDWMFVSATDEHNSNSQIFYARKPGQEVFDKVFCRRVNHVDCGCFTGDGRFFFAGGGDIWEGGIEPEDDPEAPMAVLVGVRLAPVAMLNTDAGNGGSMIVRGLAPAGSWLYAGLGGRHTGCVLRMPIPAKTLYGGEADSLPDAKVHLDVMKTSLEKTEVIVEAVEGLTAFAATETGGQGRVFYRSEGVGLFLWSGKGAPKRIADEPQE